MQIVGRKCGRLCKLWCFFIGGPGLGLRPPPGYVQSGKCSLEEAAGRVRVS